MLKISYIIPLQIPFASKIFIFFLRKPMVAAIIAFMNTKAGKEKVTISVDAELIDWIKKRSNEERRSISNFVALLIHQHRKRAEGGNPATQKEGAEHQGRCRQ